MGVPQGLEYDMKVVKPDKLTVLQRTFEHEGRCQLVLSLITGFSFDEPRALLSEVDLWNLVGEELACEDGLLDEGNLKVKGELLVNGHCYPPGGLATPVSFVRVSLGKIDKRLAVIGDRRWRRGVQTEPEPFEQMPVDWHHAFGGEGFDRNPKGIGVDDIEVDDEKYQPLPNIENPRKLINSPGDRPDPEGFGAFEYSWPQRFEKAGTYDQKWLETRYPGYAADMDPTLFNAAPEDQHIDDWFDGTETFVVENMHPDRPRIEGQLSDVLTRAFVTQRGEDGEERFIDVPMRLDTVRLIPHRLVGILVFRGVIEVEEDDADDILHLVAACEAPGKPRTAEHYQAALELRLDKEKGALAALKNDDLMPEEMEGWAPRPAKTDVQQWVAMDGYLAANNRRGFERKFAEAKAHIVEQGLDPADFNMTELPPNEPVPDADDIDGIIETVETQQSRAKELGEELAKREAEMKENARAQFAAQGLDYDDAVAQAQKDGAGPPKFNAEKQVEWMRSLLATAREGDVPMVELEQQLEDPDFLPKLQLMQAQAETLYRHSAHMQHPFEPIGRDASDLFRAEIEVAHHNDIELEARDFSGADLSKLNLEGISLSGAFLESVDLTDTNLKGANLQGAVLAHATLRNTNLEGADLSGANLGGAHIDGANLTGCRMVETVLSKAELSHVSFSGVHLEKAQLHEIKFGDGVDFGGVIAHELLLFELDLRPVRMAGADLSRSALYEVDARGVCFDEAVMIKTSLIACKLDDAQFRKCQLDTAQFVYETSLERADFSGASLPNALLLGANAREARFDNAQMDNVNLMKADLTGASLYQARARQALAIRTNFTGANLTSVDLLGAIMQKAKLNGANLLGANLFGVDLARVRADGDTNLRDANLERSRQIPRHKDGP